jgi:hypothetical protein
MGITMLISTRDKTKIVLISCKLMLSIPGIILDVFKIKANKTINMVDTAVYNIIPRYLEITISNLVRGRLAIMLSALHLSSY